MSQALVINRDELRDLVVSVTTELVSTIAAAPRLPTYYKFPEDIHAILRGSVALQTIRNWRTLGYIKVTKIGQKAFVKPADWDFFVDNHGPMMAKNSRLKTL